MELSYENKMNLAFDKPLEYKKVLLYPAKLPYYSIFAIADDYLDTNRLNEKDVRLLRLSYLDYLYEKSLLDTDFKAKWDMLLLVLSIVLGAEQTFDIVREKGNIYLKVYQRSNQYELLNKEYTILEKSLLEQKDDLKNPETLKIAQRLLDTKEKMYNKIVLNASEFDDVRELIMYQNDIKPEHFDTRTEMILNQMKDKIRTTRKDDIDIEDLITVVSYFMHIDIKDMENMTIRRFNRYLDIIFSYDSYEMYKPLEVSGMVNMKSEVKHWLNHYEPKGRYDDIITSSKKLMSSFDNNKI